MIRLRIATLTALLSFAVTSMAHANVVTNGGFENGAFVNTLCNYMQLNTGDTALTGWTIVRPLVWGLNACDFAAATGAGFVDLSGFGNQNPDGHLQQLLSTTPATSYTFSMDSFGTVATVLIDAVPLTLTPTGTNGAWTTYSGSFLALLGSTTLDIVNTTPNSQIVFVDNVSVEGSAQAVPEPGTIGLFSLGGLLAFARFRRHSPRS